MHTTTAELPVLNSHRYWCSRSSDQDCRSVVVLNWKEFFLLFLAVLGLCRCTQFLYLWPLAAGSLPLHAVSLAVANGGWVFTAARSFSTCGHWRLGLCRYTQSFSSCGQWRLGLCRCTQSFSSCGQWGLGLSRCTQFL